MRNVPVQVKTGGEVVANIEVAVFETIAEATEALGGEHAVLELVNRQHKADESNKARMANKDTSTEREIMKLARAAKGGKLTKEDLAAQLSALLGE